MSEESLSKMPTQSHIEQVLSSELCGKTALVCSLERCPTDCNFDDHITPDW